MNTKIRSVLTAASLLALSAVTSHAQLFINNIYSTVSNITGTIPTVTGSGVANANVQVQYSNLNLTGFPYANNATIPPTSGTPPLTLPNGVFTRVDAWFIDRSSDTTQLTSAFDFSLGFDFQDADALPDFTLNFHTVLTPGTSDLQQYAINPVSPLAGTFAYNGSNYNYTVSAIGLTGQIADSSNGVATIDLRVTLVTVPEPSTYALFGVVALMGVVAVRRFRSSKSVAA